MLKAFRASLRGGPLIFMMISLFTCFALVAISPEPVETDLLFSTDSFRLESGMQSKSFFLELPLRSKVIPVDVESEIEILRQADENKTRLGPDQKLTVGEAYVSLSSGERLEVGDEVSLHYPEAGRPLLDVNGDVLRARISKAVEAPHAERVRFDIVRLEKKTDKGSFSAVLMGILPTPADRLRTQAALEEAKSYGEPDDVLKEFEAYGHTASVSGYIIMESTDLIRLYRVIGEWNQETGHFALSAAQTSRDFFDQGYSLSEMIRDKVLKQREEADLREDLVVFGGQVIDVALEFQSRERSPETLELAGPLQNWTASFEVDLLADALVLDSSIESFRLLKWSNESRLMVDRQQMLGLALQPVSEKFSQSHTLAGLLIKYEPDLPTDRHICAPAVTYLPMHGEMHGYEQAQFSRLYSSELNESSVWTLEHALLSTGAMDSAILSWSFMPSKPERLETQSLTSGAKAFVNRMTKFESVEFDW